MRRLTIIAPIASLLLSIAAIAGADQSTWGQRVAESEGLLQRGEYAAAHEITAPLLREMGRALLPGERSYAALGSVLALHALAEIGSGRRDQALWHWGMAQSLKPSLRTMVLEVYGEAGAALDEHRFPVEVERGSCVLDEYAGDPVVLPGVADSLPVKVKAPPPAYPTETQASGAEGVVILQVVVDREGDPGAPYLLHADSPNLAWLAGEAVRTWRFRPALRDGEPITVCYNLTVNFVLGR